MKKRILAALILAVLTCCVDAEDAISSKTSEWFTYYYLHPNQHYLVTAVRELASRGMLQNPNSQLPAVIFLSFILRDNPKQIRGWMDQLSSLSLENKKILWSALWYADTPEAREAIETDLKSAPPDIQQQSVNILKQHPANLLKMEIDSPGALDALWAGFCATGDEKYVIRIISALPEQDDSSRVLITGAAKWSLTSNCVQHPKVLKTCKDQLPLLSKGRREVLTEIIGNAEKQIKAKPPVIP